MVEDQFPSLSRGDFNHSGPLASPTLEFDFQKYRAEIDDLGLSDAQARELLATLWDIMRSFVELGFDVDILNVFVPDDESGRVCLDNIPTMETPSDAEDKEAAHE